MSGTEARIAKVLETVFFRPIGFRTDLTADDVEEWDSVAQVELIVALEEEFKVRFGVGQFETFRNLGELATFLGRQGSSR